MTSRCLLLAVFATALILVTTKTATACKCGPLITTLEEFETSDEVVIVRAVSVEKVENTPERFHPHGVKSTTMVVEKSLQLITLFEAECLVQQEEQ